MAIGEALRLLVESCSASLPRTAASLAAHARSRLRKVVGARDRDR